MTIPPDPHPSTPRHAGLEGLRLRAPDLDDAPGITLLSNLPRYRWGTLRLPFHSLAETRAMLERQDPNARRIVAELDGTVVGFAGLHRHPGRRSHVGEIGLGVHDDHHGRGIGSALLGALIDLGENWLGLTRIELGVFIDNAPAIALYRRFGFEIEGTERRHALRDGVYVDCHRMARLRPVT